MEVIEFSGHELSSGFGLVEVHLQFSELFLSTLKLVVSGVAQKVVARKNKERYTLFDVSWGNRGQKKRKKRKKRLMWLLEVIQSFSRDLFDWKKIKNILNLIFTS